MQQDTRIAPLIVDLPLPGKECAQNDHKHWRLQHKARQGARTAAGLVARTAIAASGWKTAEKVRISCDWYQAPRLGDGLYRPLDIGNAWGALKYTIDGLVDGGVVVADTHRHVVLGEMRLHRTAKEHGGRAKVILTVEVCH